MKVALKTAPTIEPIISVELCPKREKRSGIYQIICKPTGKVYVGSAVWLAKRKRYHKNDLLNGDHHNRYLQKAWDKHGPGVFEYSILEYCEKEKLIEREQYYIDVLKAADHRYGFNLQPKAHSNLGMIMSLETRAKISAIRKRSPCTLSPVQIEELRQRMTGNTFSVGHKHSDVTRLKMKIARRGKTPALGMKQSEKFKKSMSERFKGKPLIEEHRKKISQALAGRSQTIEHRRNLAIATAKIKPDQIDEIRKEYCSGVVTMRVLADRYGCCTQTICNVINGKRTVYHEMHA